MESRARQANDDRVQQKNTDSIPQSGFRRGEGPGEGNLKGLSPLGFLSPGLLTPTVPGKGDIVLLKPGEPLDGGLWAAEILDNFGPGDDLGAQERIVKAGHGIPTFFPADVLEQAEAVHAAGAAELADIEALIASGARADLRHIPFVTIDGEDARDFDDAVYVEERTRGFTLWVGIADVSHYVRPGAPLDREALSRGNSYYFPQSVEPMLPEALSNDLCSLKPDVPRLAVAVKMNFDRAGKPASAPEFFVAVIQSRARLTYTRVFADVIEERGDRGGKPQGDNPLEVSLPGPHPSLTLIGDEGEGISGGAAEGAARLISGAENIERHGFPVYTGNDGTREHGWLAVSSPAAQGKGVESQIPQDGGGRMQQNDENTNPIPQSGLRGERGCGGEGDSRGLAPCAPLAPDIHAMLKSAEKLARLMHGVRHEAGGLDFELPEPEARVSEVDGELSIAAEERNFAHQLIEMFMVAANEAVAGHLTRQGARLPYRVHPPPDPDKLVGLFDLLARTGLLRESGFAGRGGGRGAVCPGAAALPGILDAVRGTDAEYVISRLVLRSLMQARYSLDNEGHFGLASECYCHFTSPIRRYADLLTHRALKRALGVPGFGPLPERAALEDMLDIVNADERTSKEAEREILRRLTVLILRERAGEVFAGVVSGVTDFGVFVELAGVMAEGMIPLTALADDYYDYFPERQELMGRGTRQRFYLGMPVRVRLVEANLRLLEINLELASGRGSGKDATGRRGKKESRRR